VLLVDTSVWIEFFRIPKGVDLASLAETEELVTCLPVIQEVLQGFRDERAYRKAREACWLPAVESP
jgi:predicted nucleic acid-binding protein